MLQKGFIKEKDLRRKYQREIHANEIVLLAYYIAAINIEEAYHFRMGGDYEPFQGILLADTFQSGENKDETQDAFAENSARAEKQNQRHIRVIVGNPPYSMGQKSENDANQNIKYPILDQRITDTYAKYSTAGRKSSLYDSYIRSIRWASDRIGDEGIIAFISNGSYIEGNAAAGVRKVLADEFSAIYCFNLRGNQRTQGDTSRKEGGKIFGSGSRASIAITLFVKNPMAKNKKCSIYYHDIGDYLTQKEKLEKIKTFASVKNMHWQNIKPNDQHDWINQRHPEFTGFLPIGDKSNKKKVNSVASIFSLYSLGVSTNRDSWAYNFSQENLATNMKSMIDFYNQEVDRYRKTSISDIDQFVNNDPTKIDWDGTLKSCLGKAQNGVYSKKNIRCSIYRPFTRQWLYFDRQFNNSVYRMFDFFPTATSENLAICVSGVGAGKGFSALMVNLVPNLHFLDTGQCFPFYSYSKPKKGEGFDFGGDGRIENIPDTTLAMFRDHYNDKKISKWDIFYYVYGLLHSPHYKTKFSSDLKKMLPHIPMHTQFHTFSTAGKALGDLHVNYEDAPEYPLREIAQDLVDVANRKVIKMKFAKDGTTVDKTAIVYNEQLILQGIPIHAYQYVVNGKSAIEWVMDRYQIKVHKDSQIKNDPNEWSEDPNYMIKLLKKVVHVSLESVKIIESLPELDA